MPPAALPGGIFLVAQMSRPRWSRHLPVTFGALPKRAVPDDQFRTWVRCATAPVRRNCLRNVPKREQLLEWADHQRTFADPVLINSARRETLMPAIHSERLIEHFENAQLVWVVNSQTLIPVDRRQGLT